MKKLFSKYAWLQLILSILLLFGGTLIIVFAFNNKEDILKLALNVIAAVILFLFGGFAILTAFLFERKSAISYAIVYGSASIAMGVFLCMNKLVLLEYLVYLLAIFFIVIGAIELVKSVVMTIKVKPPVYVLVLAYVFSVLFIAGGILSLIFSDKVQTAFCVIAGALLFLLGVYELVEGIKEMVAQVKGNQDKATKKNKKKEKVSEQEPVKEQPVEDAPKEPEVKELDYTSNQIEQK